ncbi:hypothetical protein Brsp07_04132 [Brucella sp. NBRC 14130]|uniref:Uncharacterized protein n=2 Tax=Hyphomicrobiales TaxID=356 RepID=A0A285UYM5_9HYPH|nr:hypothetical protein [Rhizobium subbaraonis]SOC46767.1 hypothetical protein SAMN05892877_12431 [Rhizobium subbaraonis]
MAVDHLKRQDAQMTILRRDRIGVALGADAAAVDRATVLARPQRRALAVAAREVGPEDEDGWGGSRDRHGKLLAVAARRER